MDLDRAQSYMQEHALDGWLLCEFRGNNPVFWRVAGGDGGTTRRNFIFIPAKGEPQLFAHGLDNQHFLDSDFQVTHYTRWQEMHEGLRDLLTENGCSRVALEYSPGGAIPMHSFVDAGTVEMVRAMGVDVVSSADLFQVAVAAWSEASLAAHRRACDLVGGIKDEAFAQIGNKLNAGEAVTELDIKQFILRRFEEEGLTTDHGPIVAANEHSGDPHYEPTEERHAAIEQGDWVLIDLWGKEPTAEDVYCDITWVGYAGEDVPERHRDVFETVKAARDAVVDRLEEAWAQDETLQGWQLDEVARSRIAEAGYGEYFTHRTGHSMGPSPTPHALGMNLDNLETHDTRTVIPGIGFSVEPGIYLPDAFGVRLEIDMYVDPDDGPTVTSPIQHEIIRIG